MFTHHQHLQDESKYDELQKLWQGSRRKLSFSKTFFEEVNDTDGILTPSRQQTRTKSKDVGKIEQTSLILDAAVLKDLPARYAICPLQSHQFPVCGVYIDARIIPGFKYKVRPLPPIGAPSTTNNKCLFKGRALKLQSIGRGFARRLTFEADEQQLNSNNNYFYSDNRPEGYAFELEVISEGDKFTIFDINHEAQGTLEVLNIEGPQLEISSSFTKLGIEKRANVKFTGKVEFYDTGVAKPLLLTGNVVALKRKGNGATEITKVVNIHIKKQRWYLKPGIQNNYRRVTVRGTDINDVPTKYTMTGLEPYELPVVGTYIDPRVIPGFSYKIRPNNKKRHLFDGRALLLVSIGAGYAKRLTFKPDSLVNPNNYLWSDNHPDGLGLEPRAVCCGMKFYVRTGDQVIGEATVFRDDKPQFEEKSEKIKTTSGWCAIEKHIHIDVICHIQLSRPGGASSQQDSHLMRISGIALLRKEPKDAFAKVIEVYSIGLDSQLYILFSQMCMGIKFIPKD